MRFNPRVNKLAINTGLECVFNPQITQQKHPLLKVTSSAQETSPAFLICHVLITCGKKATVERNAAAKPKISDEFTSQDLQIVAWQGQWLRQEYTHVSQDRIIYRPIRETITLWDLSMIINILTKQPIQLLQSTRSDEKLVKLMSAQK